VEYSVFGGFATSGGDATGNTVILDSGAETGNISGGWVDDAGSASGNTVIINTGAVVNWSVYGGLLSSDTGVTADNNTVILHSGAIVGGDVYGGSKYMSVPFGTGNMLEVKGSGQSIGADLKGFQIFDFSLPTALTNGGTILTVGNNADITGVAVSIGGSGLSLSAGNTIVLIDAGAGAFTGAPANTTVSGGRYNWNLSVSGNKLIATAAQNTAPTAPGAPTIGTATAGNGQATVSLHINERLLSFGGITQEMRDKARELILNA